SPRAARSDEPGERVDDAPASNDTRSLLRSSDSAGEHIARQREIRGTQPIARDDRGVARMSGFPGSPKLIRAGIVLSSPDNGLVIRIITLQYVPETLSRQIEAQAIEDGGNRSQALRLTAPAQETITLEATLDATDQLEFSAQNRIAVDSGIFPALSA